MATGRLDNAQPVSRRRRSQRSLRRRGVASVLAMMFLVMFSSLAVAMAVSSQGNLRTAETHLHIVRAMGAAETGMAYAEKVFTQSAARFIVEKGEIETGFATRLWQGTMSGGDITAGGDGEVRVLAPPSGVTESGPPAGISQAIQNVFNEQANYVAAPGVPFSTEIHSAPADADTNIFAPSYWITTPIIAIDADGSDTTAKPAAFQITFAPLASGTDIRVIVTGYSGISVSQGLGSGHGYRPIERTIQRDFRIAKKHSHAVLSPSRIMIGKNVLVTGNLGTRWEGVDNPNGHPLVIKSDFYHIDDTFDLILDDFYTGVLSSDIDGDNRLRAGHAVEGPGIPINVDYDGDGDPDNAFEDITRDGYVDEFDLFVNRFDTNGDGKVVLASALTAGTPADGLTPEFELDNDLALLIDSANPDRNQNGIYGFSDDNKNGMWDDGEALNDYDARNSTYPDREMGYRDGVIDRNDQYAKVHGKVVFRVDEADWTAEQGDYQQHLNGVIWPAEEHESPFEFGADDDTLPPIDANSFSNAQTPMKNAADGSSFEQQVASQLSVSATSLPTYTESNPDDTAPRFWRADMDDATVYSITGRHLYEKMPFNAPAHGDWYYRNRYENMVFKDVEIPVGNNGLFINCTFVGVTWIRTTADNRHPNWSIYGQRVWDPATQRPVFDTQPKDKSDFLRYSTGIITDGPANYDEFPDPPVVGGATLLGSDRNTKLYSNNIRFHNCLFVGAIVSDTPMEYTHVRNKVQFTGQTRIVDRHPDQPLNPSLNPDSSDADVIRKSSLMVPNYSVDIGTFNSPTSLNPAGIGSQNVQLNGTIIAGVIDVRGNARIDGSLLLTYLPVAGEGPLQQHGKAVGNPAGFNATLGYFGPDEGDGEALNPDDLPEVGGVCIVGYDADGDGLADTPPDYIPSQAELDAGMTAVPFYGYGRIELHWNPSLPMPDGVLLPISASPVLGTYKEGR